VGSGPNATVLHYFRNDRRMDAGELVLMDVGAECSGYAGDITRTIPVNGKFTPRQRELYNAVLKAEKAVIAAAKPGLTTAQLKKIAVDSLNDREEKLGDYLIHGVSHHIGLDVHDLSIKDAPLTAGAVITVEPGVYLPKEGIGIRIEDMIVVTENGARVLTAALPREAEEIERIMSSRAKPRD
jgi:Xaa-Pro aminopeptidase